MAEVCMYFQVHQPNRLRKYQVFDINQNHDYFDAEKNENICKKVAKNCYLPANKIILNEIKKRELKVSFSITGSALEQFEKYSPEVIESFKELAKTGRVEFLAETYYHSLSYLYSEEEFRSQVEMHRRKIKELFGVEPKVFRNTELIFNNLLVEQLKDMDFKAVLAEGADHILGWRSPDYVYSSQGNEPKLLLRNYKLSDDIAFRFSDKQWKEYPLNAEKFANWVRGSSGQVVNLFMDYETFGEHHSADSNIFIFLENLPSEILNNGMNFVTPSEIAEKFESKGELDLPDHVSWADSEKNLSAWLGNAMQENAMKELYLLEKAVKETGDKKLLEDWRMLTMSDHFYYMSTKWFSDGHVHSYFNPFDNPYEAFIAYMNILNDIIARITNAGVKAESGKMITENPHAVVNSGKK
ncbi:MAG: glycoside hydrolase family 57 protein [Candidatus Nanoarchaeia archaeon]